MNERRTKIERRRFGCFGALVNESGALVRRRAQWQTFADAAGAELRRRREFGKHRQQQRDDPKQLLDAPFATLPD